MPEYFYVYPAYLAKSGPRSMGRRVSATEAAADVSIDAIVAAASALGFRAEAEPTKHYPRQSHTYAGRVKVVKKVGVSKAQFLRDLARELKVRASRT